MMKVVISSGRVVIDHPGNCDGLRGKEELTLLLFFYDGMKWMVGVGLWCLSWPASCIGGRIIVYVVGRTRCQL